VKQDKVFAHRKHIKSIYFPSQYKAEDLQSSTDL